MKNVLVVIITSLLFITGCAATHSSGKQIDSSKVTLIKIGKSTKSDVLNYLGSPRTNMSMPGGKETWIYDFTETTTEIGKSLIPVYGYLADRQVNSTQETVTINFSGDVVIDCTYNTINNSGTTNGTYQYDSDSSIYKTTKCGNSNNSAGKHTTSSREEILEAQVLLNKHGYDAGSPDGIMGKKTRSAIIGFQQANGLTADGKVSDSLISRLRAMQ